MSKNIAIHIQFFHSLPLQQHLVCWRCVSISDSNLHGSFICMRKPYDSYDAENAMVKTHVLRHRTYNFHLRNSGESVFTARYEMEL
jgi:hypothetical protein